MTRDIKFRAWDKTHNEWLGASDPNTLTYYGFHLFGEVMMMQRVSVEELDNLVVEQFTGLKDKNGVDIYEGDVVRRKYANFESETFFYDSYRVVFRGGAFEADCQFGAALRTDPTDLEVIGNIHANPELLEQAS